ncbi:MAG: peptidoglycan D,D-transpeptidase FtsI family protein [Planctomycetota bacterium]
MRGPWFIAGCITLCFLAVQARLYHLQIRVGARYADQGRRIYAQTLEASRGTILTGDGKVLAEDRAGWDIDIIFAEWEPQTSRNLLTLLEHSPSPLSAMELEARLDHARGQLDADIQRERERLGRPSLSKAQIRQIQRLPRKLLSRVPDGVWQTIQARPGDFLGLIPRTRNTRAYPQAKLASLVVGSTGMFTAEDRETRPFLFDVLDEQSWFSLATDPDMRASVFFPEDLIGRSGLERGHEDTLRGIRGVRLTSRELEEGRKIERLLEETPPTPGSVLRTTLESRLQSCAETTLEATCNEHGGGLVLMEASTGAILAMASYPNIPAGRVTKEDLQDAVRRPLVNRCLQDSLPLGSVFKIVTAVAALEEGLERPDTLHTCTPLGFQAKGSPVQRCWISNQYHVGHGPLDVRGALSHSCNIWFFEAATRLGYGRLRKWAEIFGYGSRTGIDLPFESKGNLPSARQPEVTNFSIGQGRFLATILQATVMMSAVATGGQRVVPHLTQRDSETLPPYPVRQDTWDCIRDGLEDAVLTGTARLPILRSHHVKGKTGTAQAGPKGNHLWFAGWMNLDGRDVAFAICLYHGGRDGVSAPQAFGKFLEQLGGVP